MKKRVENRKVTIYAKQCPHCKKAIDGPSKKQVNWNLSIHTTAKHPDLIKGETHDTEN